MSLLKRSWTFALALMLPLAAQAQQPERSLPARSQQPSRQTACDESGCCTGVVSLKCQVYSLADLSDDPTLCALVAKMIPEVIEPASWKCEDSAGKRVLQYHPPTKVLVVYHCAQVHEAIAAFLKNVKQMQPAQVRTPGKMPQVTPAGHIVPAAPGTIATPAMPAVPRTISERPPHLFHIIVDGVEGKGSSYKMKNFTLRYEGDGLIDANVVEMFRAQMEMAKVAAKESKNRDEVTVDPIGAALGAVLGARFQAYSGMELPQVMPATNVITGQCGPVCPPAYRGSSANSNAVPTTPSTTVPSNGTTAPTPIPVPH